MAKAGTLQKFEIYWEEYAPEDQDELYTICASAAETISEKFHVNLIGSKEKEERKKKGASIDCRIVGCIFSKTFDAILEQLRKLEEKYSEFEINIAKRLVIGYNTIEDEEDEKEGNFMIYLRDLACDVKTEDTDDPDASSLERCVQWNAHNIESNPETLRNISISALKKLDDDLDLKLSSQEYIWPIFITLYDTLINYLKTKRIETDSDEYEINFISCFKAGAAEGENEISKIYLRPDINSKLFLKNDEAASSKF